MKSLASIALALAVLVAPQAKAEQPKEINVTYVAAPFNVPSIVMRKKGFLDAAFAAKGIKVNSHEITSGAQQIQALAGGAIDIATVLGGTSAILGRANGVDVRIVSAFSRSAGAFTIMTMPKGPTSIEALKGKAVAGPKGTTLNQLLAAALASKGMSLKDVRYLNMDIPQARQALIAGQVDAATLAGNNALAVEKAGGKAIATGKGLIDPTSVVAVNGEFLRQYRDLVETYLDAQAKALEFMAEQPEEALKLAAEEQQISLDDARKMLPLYDFSPKMTDADVAHLEADQAFMVEAGMLKKTIDVRKDLIDPMAFEAK